MFVIHKCDLIENLQEGELVFLQCLWVPFEWVVSTLHLGRVPLLWEGVPHRYEKVLQ
jgi:hypothetical protein